MTIKVGTTNITSVIADNTQINRVVLDGSNIWARAYTLTINNSNISNISYK